MRMIIFKLQVVVPGRGRLQSMPVTGRLLLTQSHRSTLPRPGGSIELLEFHHGDLIGLAGFRVLTLRRLRPFGDMRFFSVREKCQGFYSLHFAVKG